MITYFTPASISICWRNLAGVSTLLFEVHILSTNFNVLVPFAASTSGNDVDCRNAAELRLLRQICYKGLLRYCISSTAWLGVIFIFQLPAMIFSSCHDHTSRFSCLTGVLPDSYLSSAAATPGSSLPSRNSREAPPPVEMWLILSAKPSWLTAAAESPPPMMVVASVSARAFATAIVPAARVGFSNTPIGPFHTTVLACLSSLSDTVLRSSGPISHAALCQQGMLVNINIREPGSSASIGLGKASAMVTESTGSNQLLAQLLSLFHHFLTVVDLRHHQPETYRFHDPCAFKKV